MRPKIQEGAGEKGNKLPSEFLESKENHEKHRREKNHFNEAAFDPKYKLLAKFRIFSRKVQKIQENLISTFSKILFNIGEIPTKLNFIKT